MAQDDPQLLVSTEWLDAHLSAPDLRILDASWHLPGAERDARAEYDAAHIPGARFFDIDEISDTTSSSIRERSLADRDAASSAASS